MESNSGQPETGINQGGKEHKPKWVRLDFFNVYELDPVPNVCDQILRPLPQLSNTKFSVAHVVMNPLASSLNHFHNHMDEVYVILEGYGHLVCGNNAYEVYPGVVLFIPKGQNHYMVNKGLSHLSHLVIAIPPFIEDDVHVIKKGSFPLSSLIKAELPAQEMAPDNVAVTPYPFPHQGFSIAFGSVKPEDSDEKMPHWHFHTVEWIMCLRGRGVVRTQAEFCSLYNVGDVVRIPVGTPHSIHAEGHEDMVVLAFCVPPFSLSDVHFSDSK